MTPYVVHEAAELVAILLLGNAPVLVMALGLAALSLILQSRMLWQASAAMACQAPILLVSMALGIFITEALVDIAMVRTLTKRMTDLQLSLMREFGHTPSTKIPNYLR